MYWKPFLSIGDHYRDWVCFLHRVELALADLLLLLLLLLRIVRFLSVVGVVGFFGSTGGVG